MKATATINPNIDARSQLILNQLYPPMVKQFIAAADALAERHTFLCFFDGLRSAATQNALYSQGRTAPGHIVTNARAWQSYHCMGLACDVMPFRSGRNGALNRSATTPQFKEMVLAMKAAGLDWGGGWIHFKGDDDHFQFMGLGASPPYQMQQDYGKTGGVATLEAIWSKVTSGAYRPASPSH